ncbi:hephaestin-like protein [Plakobranchus ocellatus]|uniref:Hephaestin-like protein n=1 Tax=Plakobranchus ocellatus TaxID=259542 RepID=A0AAV4DPU4_9GAST|nr:hephaestin-like protein [Plakobranchus ocellatus]
MKFLFHQGLPRPYDATIPPGSVLFTNGVPYTYQNGMAIFQTPDGSYPIAQPQSSLQPVPANPGYIWATMPSAADVVYQTPQAYQGAELADATFVDGTTVEGNVIPVEQSLANRIHSPVTAEVSCTADQTSVATVPVIPVQAAAKNAVASYKKHYALTRRSFNSPTILVKHGHKVQRLMVSGTSPPTMYNGQILNPCNPTDTGDGTDAYIRYTHLPGHSTTK